MFDKHYLDQMFPYLEPERQRLLKGHELSEPFLDRVVDVDEITVARRETVVMEELDRIRSGEGLELGDREHVEGGSKNDSGIMVFARTSTGKLMADNAHGKTVRQLSRLWRYQGGRTPYDGVQISESGDISPV